MDAVHFQQYGSGYRMWIPPEIKDPVLQHHPTCKCVGFRCGGDFAMANFSLHASTTVLTL